METSLRAEWATLCKESFTLLYFTSCYRRAELNSWIINILEYIESLLNRFFIFVFCFRQQAFYSTESNSMSETKSY